MKVEVRSLPVRGLFWDCGFLHILQYKSPLSQDVMADYFEGVEWEGDYFGATSLVRPFSWATDTFPEGMPIPPGYEDVFNKPAPAWRAFKSADEVPGHLIWARRIFWREGRAPFRLWADEIELLSTGDSHSWASALDHVQLAGPDLVWQPAGVRAESGQ